MKHFNVWGNYVINLPSGVESRPASLLPHYSKKSPIALLMCHTNQRSATLLSDAGAAQAKQPTACQLSPQILKSD